MFSSLNSLTFERNISKILTVMFELTFCDSKKETVDFLIKNTYLRKENCVNKVYIWILNCHQKYQLQIEGSGLVFYSFCPKTFKSLQKISRWGNRKKTINFIFPFASPWFQKLHLLVHRKSNLLVFWKLERVSLTRRV